MQGLASIFIAISLLLSPLTGDHNSNSNNVARQDQTVNNSFGTGPAVTSIDGGAKDAITIRDTDNSNCPYKYPDITSKDYCECVVGRSDNFICNVRASHPPPPQYVHLSFLNFSFFSRTLLTCYLFICLFICVQYDCSCSFGGVLCVSSSCSTYTTYVQYIVMKDVLCKQFS
jgi:hypothetical protein